MYTYKLEPSEIIDDLWTIDNESYEVEIYKTAGKFTYTLYVKQLGTWEDMPGGTTLEETANLAIGKFWDIASAMSIS